MKPVRRRDAGEFRKSVSILKPPLDSDLDEQGQKAGPFRKCLFEIPANFLTLGGRELESARALYAEADHVITIDYSEGIHERDRVELDGTGRQFHIGHVKNVDEEDVELQLFCSEIR